MSSKVNARRTTIEPTLCLLRIPLDTKQISLLGAHDFLVFSASTGALWLTL
jgi:hypothetical protein